MDQRPGRTDEPDDQGSYGQTYHYDSHAQLTAHLHEFINAYNYGRRLKTLPGLTPYEYICKCWTNDPGRYRLDPRHQTKHLKQLKPELLTGHLRISALV